MNEQYYILSIGYEAEVVDELWLQRLQETHGEPVLNVGDTVVFTEAYFELRPHTFRKLQNVEGLLDRVKVGATASIFCLPDRKDVMRSLFVGTEDMFFNGFLPYVSYPMAQEMRRAFLKQVDDGA